uniref:Uncharacterized protein n=1 Tax=Amphimedon queenslandica TaxID=400682 RepID=A0A1X7VL47_AMPQE
MDGVNDRRPSGMEFPGRDPVHQTLTVLRRRMAELEQHLNAAKGELAAVKRENG